MFAITYGTSQALIALAVECSYVDECRISCSAVYLAARIWAFVTYLHTHLSGSCSGSETISWNILDLVQPALHSDEKLFLCWDAVPGPAPARAASSEPLLGL